MKKIILLISLLYTVNITAQDTSFRIKPNWVNPELIFEKPKKEIKSDTITDIKKDKEFLEKIQQTINGSSAPADIKNLAVELESKLQQLIKEKEELLKNHATQEEIEAKDQEINKVKKDKSIIDLTLDKIGLTETNETLQSDKKFLKRFLYGAIASILALILFLVVVWQKRKIKSQDTELINRMKAINKKNNYLEHAARIIRHDMHSGINTYIPRGLKSLENRVDNDKQKELKIDSSIRIIKDGLSHTQKVYKSVYEFTNLVKQDVVLEKVNVNLKDILEDFLSTTSYQSKVKLDDLGVAEVSPALFCTAIDNLIRNGLKFNESSNKIVKVYVENTNLIVEDNGVGMSSKTFEKIKDEGSNGLGLSIALAILDEHKFNVSCDDIKTGTKLRIKII